MPKLRRLLCGPCLLFALLVTSVGGADELPLLIKPNAATNEYLNLKLFEFVAATINSGRILAPLDCRVRVREIKQERKFSSGTRLVEMLEITYDSNTFNLGEQKAYFPMGTKVGRQQKVSDIAGVVEEIVLEADDRLNSKFIFQHDGRGHLAYLSFENDLSTAPCHQRR